MTESEISEVERFYAFYREVKLLESSQRVRVDPHSRTIVGLQSFCLNPAGLTPSANEGYEWKDQSPGIPYYKEVLLFAQKNGSDRSKRQVQAAVRSQRERDPGRTVPPAA